MPASSSPHTFAKRGVNLNPPLIAGIAAVVVIFNCILAVSWCLLRDRRKLRKLHKRRISGPVDCEKYEHSVAFAVSTGAVPAPVAPQVKGELQAESNGKSYYELIHALQREHISPAPPSPSARVSRGTADAARLTKFVLRPQDMKELDGVPIYPKAATKASHGRGHTASALAPRAPRQDLMLGVPARAELRRANSLADTASVYSSASAPMDYHDHLFRTQSFALDPAPPASAPPWISQMPKPPSPAVLSEASLLQDEDDTPFPSLQTSITPSVVPPMAHPYAHPATSSGSASPIAAPSSSTLSLVRVRTYSNPSQPPQVRWLTPKATEPSPRPARPNRPSSVSSLSTILSMRESIRPPVVVPVTITPLNVHRRSRDTPWGSVDMTRSTPLPSSTLHARVPSGPSPPSGPSMPTLPARSPKRPAPSASVERLPL